MIISRDHFDLNNKVLIEKLVAKAPLKQSPVFQQEACFLYFKQGETILSSPSERFKVFEKESVLLKCGNYFAEVFQNAPSGVCEIYAIHLYPEILLEIYENEIPAFIKPANSGHFANKIVNNSIIGRFIESLTFYFDNPQIVSTEILKLKIRELILLLLQTKSASTIVELVSHLFTPRKASISEVIHAHLYSNFTTEQMARLAGQSLSSFKRNFEKHFHDTPANYIREKRLTKAAELLLATEYSIGEICFQTGFYDSSHFSRLFQQKFKSSPSNYRKKCKSNFSIEL